MTNNPAYRQNWVLDRLKANPNESYNDMFTKCLQKFTISRVTFTKDWNKANLTFKSYQETINKAKLQESIKIEKQAVKRNILQKHEALEILTEIAQGKARKVKVQINKKEVEEVLIPTFNERTTAIKTMAEFEGWKAPTKIENTNIEMKPILTKRI